MQIKGKFHDRVRLQSEDVYKALYKRFLVQDVLICILKWDMDLKSMGFILFFRTNAAYK